MSVPIEQFWKLARTSSLFSASECTTLHDRFQAVSGANVDANARTLASWLVSEKRLSVYQAQVLLAGKPGPFFFGDYRVNDRVESGLGIRRFAGVHRPTNHRVLLHFWHGSADDWAEIESQAARHQSLDHPHLDRCYETIQDGPFRIAISEDVEGITLRSLLAKEQPLPSGDAIRITHQIALALNQIHTATLIHGFVLPNELVLQPGNHSRLRRLPLQRNAPVDFTASDPKQRLLDQADYLAPELKRQGQAPTPLSDIYALGCIFYQLLSGQPPFPDGEVAEKMQRHATEPVRPLDEFRAMPSGLSEVSSFMMAKNPELRYQQSAEVARKLEAFLGGAPKARLARPRSTEGFYLSHLEKQRERIPTHLVSPQNRSTPIQPVAPPESIPTTVASGPPEVASFKTSPTPVIETPIVDTGSSQVTAGQSPTHSRPTWQRFGMAAVTISILMLAIGLIINWRAPRVQSPADPTHQSKTEQGVSPTPVASPTAINLAKDESLIDDDGQTLWQSPTKGEPIELSYSPPAAQFFLIARPRAMLESDEGPAVLNALGPLNDHVQALFEELQLSLAEIDQLLIALTPQDVGSPRVTIVAKFNSEPTVTELLTRINHQDSPDGKRWQIADYHAIVPKEDPNVICFADETEITEIVKTGGTPPLLKRQIERLRRLTDRERHLTLLFDPHFLNADGRETLRGIYTALRGPISNFLGDEVQAATVSLHFENPFYGEVRLASSLDQDPFRLAATCRQRLSSLPEKVNDYLGRTTIERFWQPIALRFPLMLRFLHDQARIGVTDQCAVINFVAPEKSAHNLVLASQLAIEASGASPPQEPPSSPEPTDWRRILEHSMNLSFPQLSLEFALRDFTAVLKDTFPSENIQIKIVGSDLQLAGITRNQQIRDVQLKQKTVDEILTQLVRQANPVRTDSLSSVEQKLVWVLAPSDESTGKTILITTRTAATQKGYSLPKQFLANPSNQ
ncbi:MAG: protein kinase [Pirellulaceae bacterium]|nr:protein kinase [Pirellulaceae bacterium]